METDEVIVKDSTIICKLTDENNNVVVEGQKKLSTHLNANTPTNIPINDPELKAKVTKIHDVILVVQGPKVTGP
jgi:hypothetical protein